MAKKKYKNSEEYWRDREEEQRRKNITDEKEYSKEINRIYQEMMDGIQKEIESFYAKYASKEGITLAEAKKRVKQVDIRAYERKAKRSSKPPPETVRGTVKRIKRRPTSPNGPMRKCGCIT